MSSMAARILPLPAPPGVNLSQLTTIDEEDNQPEEENEKSSAAEVAAALAVATHTRTIGIIHPPPDIRNIIDTTATFVAKNGPEFEKRVLANNADKPRFKFITPSDPYHAYYQHKIQEVRNQLQSSQPPVAAADSALPEAGDSLDAPAPAPADDGAARQDAAAQFRAAVLAPRKPLEEPEPQQYTVYLPEGITGEELDVIKLTAQYVARNGPSFLNNLGHREQNNPVFHFLRPTHSQSFFFRSLTDAYSKVLMPPMGIADKLRKSVVDMTMVLERCVQRLEWDRSKEQERQQAEDELEQERMEMAMIDWHDFVVVETIEFADDEDDDLPVPMTLEDVIRRSRVSTAFEEEEVAEATEPGKEMEMEMDEEEIQLVEEGLRVARLEENDKEEKKNETNGPATEPEAPIRIVKNWKRPEERYAAERDATQFVVSPITGEQIHISEMAEHMRISLIDPKYKEQKDRMMAKIKETTLAVDDEISRNIISLARTRPDIFGTTEEEVSNAVKAEIEKKKDEQPKQVIWDGHTGSIGRTANQALSQGLPGEELADINSVFDARSLSGPAPPPKPGVLSVLPLPPPQGLALNIPRFPPPPNPMQYQVPPLGVGPPRQLLPIPPTARPQNMPVSLNPVSQPMMVNRPPMMPNISVNPHPIPVPPPPGSQFTPLGIPRPPYPMHVPPPPPNMSMIPPPPLPHGMMPPPPPPEEAPPPLPDEPEPKRLRIDDSLLIPEDQFLAQHPGPACISVLVPNVDEGNLKGQVLEITVQSLLETMGNLKEKIAGEIQLPANKQKLSGRAGFLKDNLTLAYYNITSGEILTLAFRDRGGRKK